MMNQGDMFQESAQEEAETKSKALIAKSNYEQAIEQMSKLETSKASQLFTAMLNMKPKRSDVKNHPHLTGKNGKPVKYVPIGIIYTRLDQFFLGNWSVRNFKTRREFNELVGELELVLTHPITGMEIIRTGCASVAIMQDKGTKLDQFNSAKKMKALESQYPKLKSQCISNAAATLGPLFGRDINRDTDNSVEYTPIINDDDIDLTATPKPL